MGNVYKDELVDYDGKRYHKNASGILVGTSCKEEESSSLEERNIKNFAKKVAKATRKPVSKIKIPFERAIPYEVERNVEITEGFFIFKSTRMEKIKEQNSGTKVDYKDIPIDGWILKTYYENCDTVLNANRIEQDVSKWFYVLKKDGSLVVLHIGYVITSPKTNWEKTRIYHEMTEVPMTFDFDRAGLGSAYLLDFKPIKWENRAKKACNEILYFKRNYPLRMGQNESEGESYLIQEAGTGIIEALKKLDNGRAKK